MPFSFLQPKKQKYPYICVALQSGAAPFLQTIPSNSFSSCICTVDLTHPVWVLHPQHALGPCHQHTEAVPKRTQVWAQSSCFLLCWILHRQSPDLGNTLPDLLSSNQFQMACFTNSDFFYIANFCTYKPNFSFLCLFQLWVNFPSIWRYLLLSSEWKKWIWWETRRKLIGG